MSAKTSLSLLLSYLDTFHSLVNTSMVEFIVSDLFSTLPNDIQIELLAMDDDQIAALPTKLLENDDSDTAVGDVVAGLRKHSLEMLGLVRDCGVGGGGEEEVSIVQFLDKIMPEKKMHEVCQMSKVTNLEYLNTLTYFFPSVCVFLILSTPGTESGGYW